MFKELAVIKNLRGLNLSGTPLSGAGLNKLAALAILQTLRLDGTQVTNAGVKELTKNREAQVARPQAHTCDECRA